MPEFWENLKLGYTQLDLTSTILNNDSVNFWLPAMVFPDASDMDILDEVSRNSL